MNSLKELLLACNMAKGYELIILTKIKEAPVPIIILFNSVLSINEPVKRIMSKYGILYQLTKITALHGYYKIAISFTHKGEITNIINNAGKALIAFILEIFKMLNAIISSIIPPTAEKSFDKTSVNSGEIKLEE